MRKHIIDSLENDSKLLPSEKSMAHGNLDKENISIENEDNKVYKYFTNSGKKEYNYRQKSLIAADIAPEMDPQDFSKVEQQCFHLSDKICPECVRPLKELELFCLRCQSNMSFSSKSGEDNIGSDDKTKSERKSCATLKNTDIGISENKGVLVCIKCDRIYSVCRECLERDDRCRACNNTRNVCMHCRKSLCTFCLEEVACGRNVEQIHINEKQDGSVSISHNYQTSQKF